MDTAITQRPFPLCSVHLHGFTSTDDGGTEYTDDASLIEGYCVYIRTETPDDAQQPFDISNEEDFTTLEAAQDCAAGYAQNLFGFDRRDDWEQY